MHWKLLVKFSCNLYETLAFIRLLSIQLIDLISGYHNMYTTDHGLCAYYNYPTLKYIYFS